MSETLQNPTPKISVERVSEADMREALYGSNGNPTYQEQFGITSAPLGSTGAPPQPSMAELELQAKIAEQRALDPLNFGNQFTQQAPQFEQPQPDLTAELEKFKKLYGESENEKGAARRREAELMEAFNGLMEQYSALQAQNTQPQGYGPQVPQYGGQPMGYQPPVTDPFEGIGDDDVLQGRQVKNLVQRTIGPALGAALEQSNAAMQRAAALERQLAAQAKAAAGIAPVDEWRFTAKNPWLRNLPDGQRLQAIAALKKAEEVQQHTTQVAMPTPPTDTQNRIINKVTYIEGARPDVVDSSEAAIEAAKARDYAKVMSLPDETGERARAFRQFAAKYNLPIGQHTTDLSR